MTSSASQRRMALALDAWLLEQGAQPV